VGGGKNGEDLPRVKNVGAGVGFFLILNRHADQGRGALRGKREFTRHSEPCDSLKKNYAGESHESVLGDLHYTACLAGCKSGEKTGIVSHEVVMQRGNRWIGGYSGKVAILPTAGKRVSKSCL